ncbi:DUF3772 domain-containing protein [Prosthecomicrobium pneumaticum]|uniref:Small-conductance mechanosensitive channel n=1 Tax=Prosthecomicrobium pneumaticum TaxID=81895 RepID=A0A7W9L471_9HYPH|nr:DUF3772 domain-containing protein [Prosthecomicrobium pneumaticum]MBB5755272.1 small-conductance mechanosensitive channel [Prosthecomicrobium pneumaticum]
MRQRLLLTKPLGLVLALFVALFCAWPGLAQDDPRKVVDAWNKRLQQIDARVEADGVDDRELADLRDETETIGAEAQALAATLAPRVDAADAQLKQLQPAEGDGTLESTALKADRQRAEQALAELAGGQRQAQAVATHAAYTVNLISEKRRLRFTQRLLERNDSLLDPDLWRDAAKDVPVLAGRGLGILTDWFGLVRNQSDRGVIALVVVLIVTAILILLPGRRLLLRQIRRPPEEIQPPAGRRVIAAALIVAVNTFVPLIVLFICAGALEALSLSPDRVDQMLRAFTIATVFLLLGFGLARALLAPNRPGWRFVPLPAGTAERVFMLVVAIATLQASLILVERFARLTFASLSFLIAVEGAISIAVAILVLITARAVMRSGRRDGEEREDDAEEPEGGLMRRLGMPAAALVALVAIVADLMGYVALGVFLTTQIAWVAMVLGLLVLLLALADHVTAASFHREGLVGSRLVSSIGFAPRSVTQVGVVINGAVRLVLILLALLAVSAPWGVESSGWLSWLRALFFGVTIGSITISIATIATGLAVFGAGYIATRAVQSWLDTRFLPTTRLDSGLRNSIATGVRYAGIILAGALAFGYAGVDLANIAIVAGALSVGIGFGLQSIVNNFVSGVILLAERPIRAGDWIVVGTEEGTVRRINVRATEIETFDRATVIVPNSNLISGVVKNMVLRDRSGRVIVPVSVAITADADRIRTILAEVAKRHPLVLAYPEPQVLFLNFGQTTLDFELRCYLADIANGLFVRSDLRFAILKRFREARIPLPGAPLNLEPPPLASEPPAGESAAAGGAPSPSAPTA